MNMSTRLRFYRGVNNSGNHSLDPKEYAGTIARKIIFEDLPSVFPIDEPQLLQLIFSLLRKKPRFANRVFLPCIGPAAGQENNLALS